MINQSLREEHPDIGVLLNLAFQAFKTELDAHLRASGFDDLGSSFGFVFRVLARKPLSLQQLSKRLEITPQGTLKIVNDMVDKGYVVREEDLEDGRVKRLQLTDRAKQAMAVAHRFHVGFERRLGRSVGVQMAAAMRSALEAIVREGQEASPPSRPLNAV